MTTVALSKPKVIAAFPATAVEMTLQNELIQSLEFEASIRGVTLPTSPTALATFPTQIDSLTCVDIICSVEPILGFELREGIVRVGGYQSIQSAIDHMMPRIASEWTKKKGSKP